jgi:hypothetical protein
MGSRLQDLTGQVFGRLTVLRLVRQKPRAFWECRCSCGNICVVRANHLKGDGGTRSCGCLILEGHPSPNKTHGESESAEYGVWQAMRARCEKSNTTGYHNYGGRGIRVCDAWQSYETFLRDMGRRPTPGHTIERLRVNDGYGPDNCVWATRKEQARNRRDNRIVEHNGVSKFLRSGPSWLGLNTMCSGIE